MTSRNRKLFLFSGIMLLLTGTVLLYLELTKPVIKNKDDLVFIHGPFRDYKWTGTGKSDYFIFRLQNYSNNFTINLGFLDILKTNDFINIPAGQDITIGIPKSFIKYLNTNKGMFHVYSITSGKEIYLDPKDSIKKYNSIYLEVFSIIVLMLGIGCIYPVIRSAKFSLRE
jgi:hypothetical protein